MVLSQYNNTQQRPTNHGDNNTIDNQPTNQPTTSALKLLLEYHLDVSVKDDRGQTLLHLAAGFGLDDAIETILAASGGTDLLDAKERLFCRYVSVYARAARFYCNPCYSILVVLEPRLRRPRAVGHTTVFCLRPTGQRLAAFAIECRVSTKCPWILFFQKLFTWAQRWKIVAEPWWTRRPPPMSVLCDWDTRFYTLVKKKKKSYCECNIVELLWVCECVCVWRGVFYYIYFLPVDCCTGRCFFCFFIVATDPCTSPRSRDTWVRRRLWSPRVATRGWPTCMGTRHCTWRVLRGAGTWPGELCELLMHLLSVRHMSQKHDAKILVCWVHQRINVLVMV